MLNTVTLIVMAVQEGLIDVAEADRMKDVLAKNRFVIRIRSFADLLGP